MYQRLEWLQRNFDLCIPRKGTARPQSQFPHLCVCERFIYSHDPSTYFPAAEYADRSWEYKNSTQKHEFRNWDCGRAVPFLGIYNSNFFGIYKVRSACKLRARRTEYKSVFFLRHKLLAKVWGLSGLKGRGFGDSATCRPSEYH